MLMTMISVFLAELPLRVEAAGPLASGSSCSCPIFPYPGKRTTTAMSRSITAPLTRTSSKRSAMLSMPGDLKINWILLGMRSYGQKRRKDSCFLTNNFALPALTIAQLYKCRWQIEIFFKWIKQYMRIKTFFGTTKNAVKTQIWTAISVYILVSIVKKELQIELSLGKILQILSIVLFEKVPITQVFTKNPLPNVNSQFHNQLLLSDLYWDSSDDI